VSKRSSIIDNDHYGHNDHYQPIMTIIVCNQTHPNSGQAICSCGAIS